MRKSLFFIILIYSAACSQKSDKVDSTVFLKGIALAEVVNPRLEEMSGLAASVINPGLLWTHNDSGNSAEVFLINDKLEIKLTCRLKDVVNRDWEDIAVGSGPDPKKTYVYVADIGDNLAIFPYKKIYRFEEPVLKNETNEILISEFDTITFALEGIKKDAESMMIDPSTKNIYIISKWEDPESLYELKYPYSTKDTLTASVLMTLPLLRIVAADFSDDGKEVIMKNYKNVYYWKIDKPLQEALSEPPHIVEYQQEPQGEAITFAKDGSGFFTVGERNKNKKSYLWFYPRKKVDP
jgi:hypothetical protein